MRKLTALILTAVMCFSFAAHIYAAETVTEKDVKAAQSAHLLSQNSDDLDFFNKTMPDRDAYIKDDISPEDMYAEYTFLDSLAPDTPTALYGAYIYRRLSNPYAFGEMSLVRDLQHIYFSENEETTLTCAGMRLLYFSADDLADIINKNSLGKPEDICFMTIIYVPHASENPEDCVIYIKTDSGEYILTDVRYKDDRLDSYMLLNKSEFVSCVNDDTAKAYDRFKKSFLPKTAPSFTDTDDSAVSLLAKLGIIGGYEDGTFRGGGYITRAEASRILALMSAKPRTCFSGFLYTAQRPELDVFTDVDSDHWAKKYILYGYDRGYINGSEISGRKLIPNILDGYDTASDGTTIPKTREDYIDTYAFNPESTVTEQELAKMIVSAIEPHGDIMASAEGGYPNGYVSVAKRLGICTDASDRPADRLTAAHMIKNALDASVSFDLSSKGLDTTDGKGNITATERALGEIIFFNNTFGPDRIRLKGKLTSAASDPSLNKNEIRFTVAAKTDIPYYDGVFRQGDTVTMLTGFDDISAFNGRRCIIYAEVLGGKLIAVAAE